MKYENFEQIKTIVSKIKEQEEKLQILSFHPRIIIRSRRTGEDITIETYHECDMGCYATEFIQTLCKDISTRISNFKSQLDKL